MKWSDILEYLVTGGGGLALITMIFKGSSDKRKDKKSAEQKMIEMLLEHETTFDERASKQTERIDGLENELGNLREKISKVTASKNKVIAEKDRLESDLTSQISLLKKENRTLKIKIKDLEKELLDTK